MEPNPPPSNQPDPYPSGPYRPGTGDITPGMLLIDSYKTLKANFVPFIIIAFLCRLPIMIWDFQNFFGQNSSGAAEDSTPAAPQEDPLANMSSFDTDIFIQLLLVLFLNTLSQAAMVYGTVQYFSGRKVPTDECLSKGFSMFLPALGVAIVTSAITGCGFLCFILPGCVLTSMLYLAVPVCVVENLPLKESCLRSLELTHGFRMIIFMTIMTLLLLSLFTGMGVGAIIGPGSSFFGWAVHEAILLFFAAIGSVLSAVAYIRLREHKDGVQTDEMVMIFE